MHRRDALMLAAAAALAACSPPSDRQQGPERAAIPDPADTVRPLYERYMTPGGTFSPLEEQAPWSAAMRAALVDMMARSRAVDEPILDFDPFIDAQDYQLASVAVTTDAVVENSHAVVRAHFVNLGRDTEVIYDLIWEGAGWRVDNMRGASWDLRQIVTPQP